MTGKEKCRILREIRKQIAETNGIEYVTIECTYEGNDCKGTCPKCEAEVAYLDMKLNQKRAQGERISISGLSAEFLQEEIHRGIPIKNLQDDRDEAEIDATVPQELRDLMIEELDLSICGYYCLKKANILTVGDLLRYTRYGISRLENMDEMSLAEIEWKLQMRGLSLRRDDELLGESFPIDYTEILDRDLDDLMGFDCSI